MHGRKLKNYDGQRYAKVVKNCVILVRNPLAAYISEYQREVAQRKIQAKTDNTTDLNPHSNAVSIKINQFVKSFTKHKSSDFYNNFLYFWNRCEESKYIVFYEEMEVNITKSMDGLGKFLSKVQKINLKVQKNCLKQKLSDNHRSVDAFDKIKRYNQIVSSFNDNFKASYNNKLRFVDQLLGESEMKLSLPGSYYI